jgi:hypothetical protein
MSSISHIDSSTPYTSTQPRSLIAVFKRRFDALEKSAERDLNVLKESTELKDFLPRAIEFLKKENNQSFNGQVAAYLMGNVGYLPNKMVEQDTEISREVKTVLKQLIGIQNFEVSNVSEEIITILDSLNTRLYPDIVEHNVENVRKPLTSAYLPQGIEVLPQKEEKFSSNKNSRKMKIEISGELYQDLAGVQLDDVQIEPIFIEGSLSQYKDYPSLRKRDFKNVLYSIDSIDEKYKDIKLRLMSVLIDFVKYEITKFGTDFSNEMPVFRKILLGNKRYLENDTIKNFIADEKHLAPESVSPLTLEKSFGARHPWLNGLRVFALGIFLVPFGIFYGIILSVFHLIASPIYFLFVKGRFKPEDKKMISADGKIISGDAPQKIMYKTWKQRFMISSQTPIVENTIRAKKADKNIPDANVLQLNIAEEDDHWQQSDTLSSLTLEDRLDLHGHGSTKSFEGLTANQLADRLYAAGLRQVGTIKFLSCNIGKKDYLNDLRRELAIKGIEFGYVSGPISVIADHRLTIDFGSSSFAYRYFWLPFKRIVGLLPESWGLRVVKGNVNIGFSGTRYDT